MALIDISDLTTKEVDGTGVFDELMETMQVRLQTEFTKNRIKGTDYSKVYLGAMQSVISQAISFVLGKQQADKQADLISQQTANAVKEGLLLDAQISKTNQDTLIGIAQEASINQNTLKAIEETELVKQQVLSAIQEVIFSQAKVAEMQQRALLTEAQVDKTKQETSNSVIQATVLIRQAEKLEQEVLSEQQQVLNMVQQVLKSAAEVSILGKQELKLDADILLAGEALNTALADTALTSARVSLTTNQAATELRQALKINQDIALSVTNQSKLAQDTLIGIQQEKNLFTEETRIDQEILLLIDRVINEVKQGIILDNQAIKISNESDLLAEKRWTEQAQLKDTVNGAVVVGLIGKQKILFDRQSEGFLRDAEQKLTKIMTDTWAVRKSSDPNGTGISTNNLSDSDISSVVLKAKAGIGT